MAMGELSCRSPQRRALLLGSDLDGIDAVEVAWDDQTTLRVYFLVGPPPVVAAGQVSVHGGVRVTGVRVLAASADVDDSGEDYLRVTVDRAGDFSTYELRIADAAALDPRLARASFSFKAGCPSDLDCARPVPCPPDEPDEPLIDYLAKDYASFRRLLLDLAPGEVPEWTDRHEADLGVTLVELLAHEGDLLSYHQDAVANEAWLSTARQRETVRRHVRLVDYTMHQGSSAVAFVHLEVDTAGRLPAASLACPERSVRVLSRLVRPLRPGTTAPPAPVIDAGDATRAIDAADAVFEVVAPARLHPALNEIAIHTWGDGDCCLPAGATTVDLVGAVPVEPGDLLLLEEVRGVRTGRQRDADASHRQVVRVTEVDATADDLLTAGPDGTPVPRQAGDPPLAVTAVGWAGADALSFPLCVSTIDEQGDPIDAVAVARGNIVVADHGVAVVERHPFDPDRFRHSRVAPRLRLGAGPLGHGLDRFDGPASRLTRGDPRESVPRLLVIDGDGAGFAWLPRADLLRAGPFTRAVVAEPDHGGRALVRFGDGVLGRRPEDGDMLSVRYRVGVGRPGNVGRETLAHVIEPEVPPPDWPVITGVRNPLPAAGGIDPEPIERVRILAPDAFRAVLGRAVTEEDYARAAEELAGVARAVATFRWTGSWLTVFVSIDPQGTDELDPALAAAVRARLQRFRQAGYDLEIRPPDYVALDIGIFVCAERGHRAAHVRAALLDALSDRSLPDGRRGFFHPDRFTFGQALHTSALYAAVEAVAGVGSAEVTRFGPYGDDDPGPLAAGRIEAGRLQILRLANDPSLPEHGVLEVTVEAPS